jgi:hypothetical protein
MTRSDATQDNAIQPRGAVFAAMEVINHFVAGVPRRHALGVVHLGPAGRAAGLGVMADASKRQKHELPAAPTGRFRRQGNRRARMRSIEIALTTINGKVATSNQRSSASIDQIDRPLKIATGGAPIFV